MSFEACMNMDIEDYISYLEFDLVRYPEQHNTPDFED